MPRQIITRRLLTAKYTWHVHVNAMRNKKKEREREKEGKGGWERERERKAVKARGTRGVNKKFAIAPLRHSVTNDHRSAKTVARSPCTRVAGCCFEPIFYFFLTYIPKRPRAVAIAISKFILPLRRLWTTLFINATVDSHLHSVFVRHLQKRIVTLFSPDFKQLSACNKYGAWHWILSVW